MADIEPCSNVRTFFVEHVAEAMRQLRVETAAETQGYLVDLLSAASVSEKIRALSEPLVALFQKALQASGPERLHRMRDLGDAALLTAGFFPDSADRRGLNSAYLVSMGGRAYLVVGEAVREQGARGRVFVELAGRFREMAQVLDEVRERTAMCTDGEVVRLYERWCKSGSPSLAHRLQRRGVHPARPGRGTSLN